MTKLWALALSLPLTACTIGDGGGAEPGDGGVTSPVTISESATWSGTMAIDAITTIAAGVTITVAPGTEITIARGKSINVAGTFDAQGTKELPVTIRAATAGEHHYGFIIPTGGTLHHAYVTQTGGGIQTTGGTATISDSRMAEADGDWLVMSGGSVDVQYSQLGKDPGQVDTTHCDLHFDGVLPNTIKVTHSNIGTTPFGVMFYKGVDADFTFNNWYDNGTDVATSPGVSGDFSNSWFESNTPPVSGAGATLTIDNISATRLTDAGPR